jgi:hypothetical protein
LALVDHSGHGARQGATAICAKYKTGEQQEGDGRMPQKAN